MISKLTAFKKFPTFSFNTRILSGTSFTANMIYVNNTAWKVPKYGVFFWSVFGHFTQCKFR